MLSHNMISYVSYTDNLISLHKGYWDPVCEINFPIKRWHVHVMSRQISYHALLECTFNRAKNLCNIFQQFPRNVTIKFWRQNHTTARQTVEIVTVIISLHLRYHKDRFYTVNSAYNELPGTMNNSSVYPELLINV